MSANTIYVGRPTKWGNPYKEGNSYTGKLIEKDNHVIEIIYIEIDAKTAVRFYQEAIEQRRPAVKITLEEIQNELSGHDLACWCPLDKPCHADVLLQICLKTAPIAFLNSREYALEGSKSTLVGFTRQRK